MKAPLPIDVTLEGMVNDVKPLQPAKALLPIDVTFVGITVFLHPVINVLSAALIIALQLSRESYTVLPSSTIIDVKPLQTSKALRPIDVTLEGIVNDVKPLHSLKAHSPIDVTLEGIVTDFKLLQP